ncbi:MAG: hypothetical protein CM1200mP22_16350 [Dehalococcoidia bacterium]|nr:MAG: hypothetical protein CM1200mP22_16350 [Dehalococcoidia bacterium]
MSITGEHDGDPKKWHAVGDIGAGMWAAFAVWLPSTSAQTRVMIRAVHRYLDDGAQGAWLTYQAANFFATGTAPKRLGAAIPTSSPIKRSCARTTNT